LIIRWSASILLATVVYPNDMRKFKVILSTSKFVSTFPFRIAEWTANIRLGPLETVRFGIDLSLNVTYRHKFNIGPKLEDLSEIKKGVTNLTIKFFKSKVSGK